MRLSNLKCLLLKNLELSIRQSWGENVSLEVLEIVSKETPRLQVNLGRFYKFVLKNAKTAPEANSTRIGPSERPNSKQ